MDSSQENVATVQDGAKDEPITDAGDQAVAVKDKKAVRIFRLNSFNG